jgi:hypothetical protein
MLSVVDREDLLRSAFSSSLVRSWRVSPQLLCSGEARFLIVSGLNPTAHNHLAHLGRIVGILFLALTATLITTGIGWFRRRLWGWKLAIVIISTQVAGDVVNCVRGDWLRGGSGIIIAGALLLFLLQSRIRAAFA